MRVLRVEMTPNPNARKFVLSQGFGGERVSFFDASAARGHVLGEALFAVEGVACVMLLGDFATITKTPGAKWEPVVAGVKRVLEGK